MEPGGLTHQATQPSLCPGLLSLSHGACAPGHWDISKQVRFQPRPGVLGICRKAAAGLNSVLDGRCTGIL